MCRIGVYQQLRVAADAGSELKLGVELDHRARSQPLSDDIKLPACLKPTPCHYWPVHFEPPVVSGSAASQTIIGAATDTVSSVTLNGEASSSTCVITDAKIQACDSGDDDDSDGSASSGRYESNDGLAGDRYHPETAWRQKHPLPDKCDRCGAVDAVHDAWVLGYADQLVWRTKWNSLCIICLSAYLALFRNIPLSLPPLYHPQQLDGAPSQHEVLFSWVSVFSVSLIFDRWHRLPNSCFSQEAVSIGIQGGLLCERCGSQDSSTSLCRWRWHEMEITLYPLCSRCCMFLLHEQIFLLGDT